MTLTRIDLAHSPRPRIEAAEEEWQPIPSWPGYEVSSIGRVRSLDRVVVTRGGRAQKVKGRLLRTRVGTAGYPMLALSRPGGAKQKHVHSLVAEAFYGPRPEGMEVRHLDGNPLNCTVENLKYGTPSENCRDTIRHGRNVATRRTVCPRNHPLLPPNLTTRKGGHRFCKACKYAHDYQNWHSVVLEDFQAFADQALVRIMSGEGKHRLYAPPTHCRRGHEFTDENTYVTNNRGHRQCRTCRRTKVNERGRRIQAERRDPRIAVVAS